MRKQIKMQLLSAVTSLFLISSFGAASASEASNAADRESTFEKLHYNRIEELPDGGKIYVYIIQGEEHRFPVPPKDFQPLSATDEELAAYGFPPRPDENNQDSLNDWTELMSHCKYATIPELKLEVFDDNEVSDMNNSPRTYTGSAGLSSDGGGYFSELFSAATFYTQAQGDFVQPTITETSGSCANSFLVGLGNLGMAPSVGAGTKCFGKNQAYAYYQCYGGDGTKKAITDSSVPVNPGDKVHVYIAYQKANNNFNYYIVNVTTGKYTSEVITFNNSYFCGSTVCWYAGRPKLSNGTYYNLGKFTNVSFTNCKAMINTSTSWVSLSNLYDPKSAAMSDSGNYLCEGAGLSGDSFYCKWSAFK